MGEELDPFGRRKDEDPLASLGWHGDATASSVEPEPQSAVPVAAVTEQARQPRQDEPAAGAGAWRDPTARERTIPRPTSRPRRRSGAGRVGRAVILLIVGIAVLNVVIGLLADEDVERAERFADEFVQPPLPVPAVPRADEDGRSTRGGRRPVRGVTGNSLLRPAAFRRALAVLRAGGDGRLMNLRVAPDRVDATAVTKGGRLRLLQIVPGSATVKVLQTAGGFAHAHTMTLKGIDVRAPSRLTRAAAGRLRQPASRVNYLVLSQFAGARQWNVYFKGGQIFSADTRGRITRRIS